MTCVSPCWIRRSRLLRQAIVLGKGLKVLLQRICQYVKVHTSSGMTVSYVYTMHVCFMYSNETIYNYKRAVENLWSSNRRILEKAIPSQFHVGLDLNSLNKQVCYSMWTALHLKPSSFSIFQRILQRWTFFHKKVIKMEGYPY